MKKILSLFLCLALIVACFSTVVFAASEGLHNFAAVNSYYTGLFTDVSSNDWFENEVRVAYELGLVQGNSATTFNPYGNMRISEAITLASRLHSIYYANSANFVQGYPWYQVYVDYAVNNGIIYDGQFADYNANATRAEFAVLLSAALPDEALPAINSIESIPDIYGYEVYSSDVYKLYNAGILSGNDDKGTFAPTSAIKRSEVAAIMARMALPSVRKEFSLSENNEPAPTMLNKNGNIGVDTFSVSLNVGQSTTIMVEAYGDGVTATVDYNPDYVSTVWGEWDGDVIPVTITAINNGFSELKFYIEEDPASCVFVDVWTELPASGGDIGNTGNVNNSSLTIEGVGGEYEYWWSAKIRNTSKLVSADYSIDEFYNGNITINVDVLVELLEVIGGADSIQIDYELFDDRGVCVETGSVFVNASHTNQLYAYTITILDLKPGNYTMKFRDHVA